jgi:hypothetical protein
MIKQSFVVRFYRVAKGVRRYGHELGPFSQITVHEDRLWADQTELAEVIFNEWQLKVQSPEEEELAGPSLWTGFDITGRALDLPSFN